MSLAELLQEVWKQALLEERSEVVVGDLRARVERSRSQRLRLVAFVVDGRSLVGIEQNPLTRSRWAQLAQEGRRIMQFSTGGRYVANVCDGVLTRYPAWKARGLPD